MICLARIVLYGFLISITKTSRGAFNTNVTDVALANNAVTVIGIFITRWKVRINGWRSD